MDVARMHENLIEQIKQLEDDRQKHAAAVAEIDQVLGRIDQAIRTLNASAPNASERSAREVPKGEPRPVATLHSMTPPGRARRYRKLNLTGEKAIVAFIRQHEGATTAEINAHWRAEGRGGLANNAIGKLLRRGELVREPLSGRRGSRYRWSGGGEASAHSDVSGRDNSAVAPEGSRSSAGLPA